MQLLDTTEEKNNWLLCIGILAMSQIPYVIVNSLPLDRQVLPFILGEEKIPLIPLSFVIYVSAFLHALIVIRNIPKKLLKLGVLVSFILLSVSLFIFIIIPIQFPRDLYPTDNWFVNFYRIIDASGNCFPSLHVSMAVFLTGVYQLVAQSKTKKVLMWIWAFLIVVSVLTTKQHYLIDVFGAITLAIPFIILFREEKSLLA
jgi:membrane-associated phospholipid phosphatase